MTLRALTLCLFLVACSRVFATNYYVTQGGSASPLSTNSGAPSSVATYNASSLPTGGDTVFFSGASITTAIVLPKSGTSSASRITLDFSGVASLNVAVACFNLNQKSNYIIDGGGRFNAGVFTPACDWSASSGSLFTQGSSGGTACDSITFRGFYYVGAALTTDTPRMCVFNTYPFTNLTITENYCDNFGQLMDLSRTTSHDFSFTNNYVRTNPNDVTGQVDIVTLGDTYNVLVEGNKFIQQTPGLTSPGQRHNDCIQCYQSGSSPNGAPYGWIIRYNWVELNVASGTGDNSWTMLENMTDNGGTLAMKIYGNVFYGDPGTAGNNGNNCNSWNTGTVQTYNNTYITNSGLPDHGITYTGSSNTAYFRNNICYSISASGGGTPFTMTFTAGATWNRNFFFRWGTQTTGAGANGSSTTDPLFTSVGTLDFSLGGSSTLRNAGDATIGSEFNQGIAFGATWPNPALQVRSPTWDAGAYQYVDTGAPAIPTNYRKPRIMAGGF